MAEVCNQYLAKGRQVLVEGTLRPDPETGGPRIWTDQNGQPRASFELTGREVKFLGTRGESGGDFGGDSGPEEAPGLTEDEIPF
jgi:single-strand DNA-binding protein